MFDCDSHARLSEAMGRARGCGISVAFSNPCFELWFLFHFRPVTAYTERDVVLSLLREHVPGYEKAQAIYQLLLAGQGAAIAHAERVRVRHRDAGDPETMNPSTTVDRLVVYLNELGAPR